MAAEIQSAKLYTNYTGLERMKALAKTHDKAITKQVAQQFEAVFIQLALKNMREANKEFKSDLLDDDSMQSYEDLYDKQLSLSISNDKFGLAKLIEKQLEKQN